MSTQARLGAAALERRDFAAAIEHYSSALAESPTAPDYYIKRSTAHQRSSPPRYESALQDAESAVHHAHQRGKRELIATAQLRRGIALFGLKRFADAGKCFRWARSKNEKEQGLDIWLKKVEVEMQKAGDAQGNEATLVEIPELKPGTNDDEKIQQDASMGSANGKATVQQAPQATKAVEGVQTPANKIRHEWYQTADTVVVTLLAKGVPKDQTTIDIRERSVTVSFPMPNGSTFDFSLDPLFATVDTTSSRSSIMSTKVELQLRKCAPGQKWKALEGTEQLVQQKDPSNGDTDSSSQANTQTTITTSSNAISTSPNQQDTVPSYPTSSRKGPKNWDKLAADLTKKAKPKPPQDTTTTTTTNDSHNSNSNNKSPTDQPSHGEEADEAETYIDEDEEEEGDPVQGFFKKLYAGADPDTRRAMMKSYQESNGTALSTNWAEVGKAPVETSPPDGMVAKKWED